MAIEVNSIILLVQILLTQYLDAANIYSFIGDDVEISWTLNPIPDAFDIISVRNPNAVNLFYASGTVFVLVDSSYTGRIVYNGNTATGQMQFTLINITKLDAGKPAIALIRELSSPFVNNDLKLNCSTTSTTVPGNHNLSMTYRWNIDGVSITTSTGRYIVSGSLITITNIQQNDINKIVTCTGIEQGGLTSDESDKYTLQPLYGPDIVVFTPPTKEYSPNEHATIPDILCSSNCYPNCNYRWTKDGQVTSDGSGRTLSLRNINRNDTGVYRCTAWNVYNTNHSEDININVLYLDLYTMVSTVVFENTQDIHLACDARGNPSDIVFQPWTQKVGSKIIRSLAGSITSNTTVLRVPYSSYQDHGIYTCYADNKYGTLAKSKDTTVTVNDKPVITETVITQEQNGSGKITVDFYSVPKPLKVEWLQKDTIISLSEKFRQSNIVVGIELTLHDVKIKLEGYRAKLMISSLTDSDYGTYVLRIENDKGVASQQIEFKPKDKYKLIIGLSVGIVIPVLIAAVAITMYISRRQKQRNQTDKVGEITHYEDIDSKKDDTNVYQGISLEVAPDTAPVISGYTNNQIIYEPENKDLTCRVNGGNPLATITWTCRGSAVSGTNHSVEGEARSAITLDINRDYNNKHSICRATHLADNYNKQTNVTFTVYSVDLFTMASNRTFDNTQDIQLICSSKGNVIGMIFHPWTHKIGPITVRTLNGSNTINQTVLFIPYISYQDGGTYTCYVYNSYGKLMKSKDIEVSVNDKPVITETIKIQENDNHGELIVDFYSVPKPLKVEWSTKGSIISLSEKYRQSNTIVPISLTLHNVKVTLEGYRAQLSITSITEADYRTYILRIENSKGKAEQHVDFQRKAEKKDVTDIGVSIGVTVGVVVVVAVVTIVIVIRCRRNKQKNEVETVAKHDPKYEDLQARRETNVYNRPEIQVHNYTNTSTTSEHIEFESLQNADDSKSAYEEIRMTGYITPTP